MADQNRARWSQFGSELRRIRLSSGMTQRKLAGRLTIHYTMLGKIERAERTPQRDHAEELDIALETGGKLTRLWQELAGQSHVPDWFKNALLLERRAQEIRSYESTVVPGLLQTADYARTLVRERRITAEPEEVEQVVKTRIERLPTLLKAGRPLLWFIIKESVLLDVVGDETIMREELKHIVTLAEDQVARVQILPATAQTSIGLCLPFWTYKLSETHTVAYAEHVKGGAVFDTPDMVEDLRSLFGHLQAEALPPSESVKLISTIMENRYEDVEKEQL